MYSHIRISIYTSKDFTHSMLIECNDYIQVQVLISNNALCLYIHKLSILRYQWQHTEMHTSLHIHVNDHHL